MEIIPLEIVHWPKVKSIYEEGISTGTATLETVSPDWQKWSDEHLPHSRFVITEHNEVVGWAALTPVSGRCVYAGVAEVSVYVSPDVRGRGIGALLLNELIRSSEKQNIWTLQASIMAQNTASVRLHEKSGFRIVGYREKIGQLNDQWRDIHLLERRSKTVGV